MENWLSEETTPKSLADKFTMPDRQNFSGTTLLSTIMIKGGQFEPLFSNPDFFYTMTGEWWKKWYPTFNRWAEVLETEYNPMWDRDGYETIQDRTEEKGTVDTATTNNEISNGVTANSKMGSNSEDTSDETTYNKAGSTSEVVDDDTSYSKNGNSSEIVDGDTSYSKTANGTESSVDKKDIVVDGPETSNGSTTTNSVSAFDSSSWENHDKSVTSTKRHETTDEDSTHNGSNSSSENGSGTDDRTTNGTYSESGTGTDDRTTQGNYSEGGNGTDNKSVSTQYSETGNTQNANTSNATGSVDTDTSNSRDYSHTLHSWGNWGISQTVQKLATQELDLRIKYNIYEVMSDVFLNEMAVRVY